MLDLAQKQSEAILDADMQAMDRDSERAMLDQLEVNALSESHNAQQQALKDYNQKAYENQGQIVADIESKVNQAKQQDEKTRKRENALYIINQLGDTLSSFANLVGVSKGAANQKQTYSTNELVNKVEEARKARKLEMDTLSKRLDEMKAHQRDLKAAGSLKEAELKAANDKEMFQQQLNQRKAAEEAQRYNENRAEEAKRYAYNLWDNERKYNAQQQAAKQAQENWQKNYNMQYAKFKEEQNSKNYNFTLANDSIDIPKEKLNEVNVERIFQMLPEEIKKSIKGEQYTEIIPADNPMMEPTRKTSYKAPSLAQKLAAIGAYADTNDAVRDELYRLAGKTPQKKTTTPSQTGYVAQAAAPINPTFVQNGFMYDQYKSGFSEGHGVSVPGADDPFSEFK